MNKRDVADIIVMTVFWIILYAPLIALLIREATR